MCKEEKSKIEGSSKLDSAIDTTAIRSDLQRAVLLHQSGELAQAGTIYKRILDVDPKNGDCPKSGQVDRKVDICWPISGHRLVEKRT